MQHQTMYSKRKHEALMIAPEAPPTKQPMWNNGFENKSSIKKRRLNNGLFENGLVNGKLHPISRNTNTAFTPPPQPPSITKKRKNTQEGQSDHRCSSNEASMEDGCKRMKTQQCGSDMTIPVTSADSSEADNNGDDDDDDDDDDDVLPRYRVIDIPLSIRAQAYLSDGNEQEKKEKRVEKAEGIKDKSNIGNQSSGGALVLYSPRPSSWSWSPPPNSSKRDDSQTEDAIGAAHFTLPRSPSPSFMDID